MFFYFCTRARLICMKLIFIAFPPKPLPPPVFFLKPDTALLRNNQPFFLPDYTQDLRATLSLVLRISRLGRSIGASFAARYFDAVGVGMDIFAHDLRQKYALAHQPADGAHAFDYAAPVSAGWIPAAEIPAINDCSLRWTLNGKETAQNAAIAYTPEIIIPHISQFITLRTGDYIFINTSLTSDTLHPGDRLVACLNGKEMLKVEIR
ncbi:MAG: fumarylacetoacetate hydrolase family protein [Prevotellaceae bacterium]|jgi:2-keto-4-pentenoate hydratase/2-oxohepta-3-ene-1,7-dioic acid hydratase in catechol pathway|nr:fumarylacetoacetate hydrolase family protein [Prevotellaceae bacterium]